MIRRLRSWMFVVAVALLAPVSGANACVGCRQVGEGVAKVEPETIQAGIALSWSVLFLLAVVFGVLTFFGFYVARTIARIENDRAGLS